MPGNSAFPPGVCFFKKNQRCDHTLGVEAIYRKPGANPLHLFTLVRYECCGMSVRQPLPIPCSRSRHKQTCGVSAELTTTDGEAAAPCAPPKASWPESRA